MRHAERIGKETFEKFIADRGYSSIGGALSKSVQLLEANSPEEGIQQVRLGGCIPPRGGWGLEDAAGRDGLGLR